MIIKPLGAILLLLSSLGPALADGPTQAAVAKEKQTLESFAAANKSCREWSDGCAVCVRHDDGSFACSLPGIACEPTAVTCRTLPPEPKADDKTVPPPPQPDAKAPVAPAAPAK